MYINHFGLNAPPFSIAPDPRYLYMSDPHRDALAHLLYGVRYGGFVLLTGEVGTGKTTICRCLLKQLPQTCECAIIFNPKLSELELLAAICDEFRIPYPPASDSIKAFVNSISTYMLGAHAAGRTCVLIIDEAQNLGVPLLELMRLLTNLETDDQKLLQIILIGQPELRDVLKRPELRQLAQRITARYHLGPLTLVQTGEYIAHRIRVAGKPGTLFEPAAVKAVFALSGGIPRVINILCDRALLAAFVENAHKVTRSLVKKAAGEALAEPTRSASVPALAILATLAALMLTVAVGLSALAPDRSLPSLLRIATSTLLTSPSQPGTPFMTSAAQGEQEKPALAEYTAASQSLKSKDPAVSDTVTDSTVPFSAPSDAAAPNMTVDTKATPASTDPVDASTPATSLTIGLAVTEPLAKEGAEQEKISNSNSPEEKPRPGALAERDSGELLSWHQAVGTLFKQWGLAYNPTTHSDPCQLAAQYGLECLHRMGDIKTLKQLNRPAILTLNAETDGPVSYATLTELRGDQGSLAIGDSLRTMTLQDLGNQWSGELRILWRAPPGFAHALSLGDESDVVAWVRERLAYVLGDNHQTTHSRLFDAGLLNDVRRFQAQSGLEQNGIISPIFLIRLSTAVERAKSASHGTRVSKG